MSLVEWAALPEDEPGELVDGLLVEEEVSGYVHEVVVGWLIHMLRVWITPAAGWWAARTRNSRSRRSGVGSST